MNMVKLLQIIHHRVTGKTTQRDVVPNGMDLAIQRIQHNHQVSLFKTDYLEQ